MPSAAAPLDTPILGDYYDDMRLVPLGFTKLLYLLLANSSAA